LFKQTRRKIPAKKRREKERREREKTVFYSGLIFSFALQKLPGGGKGKKKCEQLSNKHWIRALAAEPAQPAKPAEWRREKSLFAKAISYPKEEKRRKEGKKKRKLAGATHISTARAGDA